MCANGMYSKTGLVPCQLCPRHTFSGPPIVGQFMPFDCSCHCLAMPDIASAHIVFRIHSCSVSSARRRSRPHRKNSGGFKKCTPCSSGTYTARLGSSGPSHCKQPCQPGTFSLSGLEPCSPCPLHHYQPALGQQRYVRFLEKNHPNVCDPYENVR
ncbi:hypothetical protein KIN20_000922 [Parelaphostrongylus tenuis]|uniref:Tyrosine-protein kinase ephrin type A/B receptor-like domain-containing protein n=1 Tax=Parelaphostrongylus tenuis TaxID=148309 RepID=A0AAD5MBW6_PARTN|nr:hypothetical protein KIN20_000922 [Parelaphostrongylus tenuis]